VLDFCSDTAIGFIPWSPIAAGELARARRTVANLARQHGATPGQIALAWLLRRSPVMLPIPGTSSVAHLEENVAAARIHLTDAQFHALARVE
jgi:aryl-alcohol dehydrogenase-like predicted oxidoreductase